MPHIQPDPPPGLHRLSMTPGVTTVGELATLLAAVPAGAVLMSASGDLDTALLELVDLAVPAPYGIDLPGAVIELGDLDVPVIGGGA